MQLTTNVIVNIIGHVAEVVFVRWPRSKALSPPPDLPNLIWNIIPLGHLHPPGCPLAFWTGAERFLGYQQRWVHFPLGEFNEGGTS